MVIRIGDKEQTLNASNKLNYGNSIHIQYCHNLSQDIRLGVGLGKELGLGLGLGNRRSKALKPLLAILNISLLGTVLGSPI